MNTWRGTSVGVEQTLRLGRVVAELAVAGDLIALVGELGAGKTQFVRGLARGLGAGDVVSSPTFVMVQEHAAPGRDLLLVHVDAYRLSSLADLESIGWEITGDTLGGQMRQGAIVAVEWADRLADMLGPDYLAIHLHHAGGQRRSLTFTPYGDAWLSRWPALVKALNEATVTHACPICQTPVPAGAESFPFCSPRCRMVDLGRWLNGNYTISRPIEQADMEEGE